MPELILHPRTKERIDAYLQAPGHSLLLVGPSGMGKGSLVRSMVAELMQIPLDRVGEHQYVRLIGPGKDPSISIEKIRELEQFLSRKVPGDGRRVVVIEDAQLMSTEAQNSLLKTLEEPPEHTLILLTAAHEQALLPTIRSRAPGLEIVRLSSDQVKSYFQKSGFDSNLVARAHAMSGGLPGLMAAILHEDSDHPLLKAAATARQIAQGSMFDRLALVDALSKDREQCMQVLTVLQQMSRVSLRAGNMATSWQRILKASHVAIGELLSSGQPKLVLTNLMLSI
jgi:hypothetical protein